MMAFPSFLVLLNKSGLAKEVELKIRVKSVDRGCKKPSVRLGGLSEMLPANKGFKLTFQEGVAEQK